MNIADSPISNGLAAPLQHVIQLLMPPVSEQQVSAAKVDLYDRGNDRKNVRYRRQLGPGARFVVIESGNAARVYNLKPQSVQADFLEPVIDINSRSYMVHGELILAVPDFSESAYAKRMPWNDSYNPSWNLELKPFGMFRCFFNKGLKGNYNNFYEMVSPSNALPFYARSTIPQYYSEEGNCDENTFCPEVKYREFEQYKPFSREGRGYCRSYFYGTGW